MRAAVELARHHDEGSLKAKEISSAVTIPAGLLPQILLSLSRAGVVRSQSGPRGGHRLARPPERISLLEVIEAVEGTTTSDMCLLEDRPCRDEVPCAAHEGWSAAQEAFQSILRETTLKSLVGEAKTPASRSQRGSKRAASSAGKAAR